MIAKTPVVFLAFANSMHYPLSNLKDERKSIKNALTFLESQGRILVKEEAETDVEDIFTAFNRYQGRLMVFHYGGHADPKALGLQDAKLQGRTLAELAAIEVKENQQGMVLVFLNGCATQEQVKKLLEVGVKCVIATATSVGDETASIFAGEFYKALTLGKDLQGAFDTAKAFIEREKKDERFYSSEKSRGLDDTGQEALIWGIYTKNELYKTWKLLATALDFDELENQLALANYVKVIKILDDHFAEKPDYRFSQLKMTIGHHLENNSIPPPATKQGLEIFINDLKRKLKGA